jgi:hypothetical protein
MTNTYLGEEGIQFFILASLVGLNCYNLFVEQALYKSLELLKFRETLDRYLIK